MDTQDHTIGPPAEQRPNRLARRTLAPGNARPADRNFRARARVLAGAERQERASVRWAALPDGAGVNVPVPSIFEPNLVPVPSMFEQNLVTETIVFVEQNLLTEANIHIHVEPLSPLPPRLCTTPRRPVRRGARAPRRARRASRVTRLTRASSDDGPPDPDLWSRRTARTPGGAS